MFINWILMINVEYIIIKTLTINQICNETLDIFVNIYLWFYLGCLVVGFSYSWYLKTLVG